MRILHIIRGLVNSSGTTHIVGPLAEAQAALGHHVKIMFVETPGEEAVVPDASLVTTKSYPMTIRSGHFGWSRTFQQEVRQELKNTDVLHVHAIWNFPTWIAMREAKRAGVPYMVSPQGSLEPWALNRSHWRKRVYAFLFEKPLFDKASAMQALTKKEAEQILSFGIKSPIRILPNGVCCSRADGSCEPSISRTELGLAEEVIVFLFLGRLFPKKGIELLLHAFALLAQERDDARLLIAGHDAGSGYQRLLQDQTTQLRLDSKVQFVGEVRGNRKAAILSMSDVFVLPSYSEGLPIAVLEAMSGGTPVIITQGCNIPEVAEHSCGWEVSANAESLVSGMRDAATSKSKRLQFGRNAEQLVRQSFAWPKIAEQSLVIYREMTRAG